MTGVPRYLEEDPSTTVLERRRPLQGYELYVVEQWACSRVHPTFVIVTFTGNTSHSVLVSVLSIPTNEEAWSPRLRLYFKAVSQYHARRKETPLGILMVTNLSGFPSALTVVLVPEGDIKKHREDLMVNEDLKRLGCSGRAGLSLSPPNDATQSKFYQLYKTSDRIPLQSAVIELVKLCQLALMLFGILGAEYADGLLCDFTERAITDWWTEIGTDLYNTEPRDGILGPTTVAAILGTLMGARNRLSAYGAPVNKDPFEVGGFKRGIGYFQKTEKLPATRRLDRQTLDKLHRVTAKAASGEGWMVPKTVKSTVAELSGKGGGMVMGMVGARDKAGMAEIETLDIERLVQLAQGERCKWLWYGKPRKSVGEESTGKVGAFDVSLAGRDNNEDQMSPATRRDGQHFRGSRSETDQRTLDSAGNFRPSSDSALGSNTEAWADRDSHLKRMLLKGKTGKRNDARSGLERIKDAVGISGFRGHHHRLSKEYSSGIEASDQIIDGDLIASNESRGASRQSNPSSGSSSTRKLETEGTETATPIRTRMEERRKEREFETAQTPVSHAAIDPASPFMSKVSSTSSHAEFQAQRSLPGADVSDAELRIQTRDGELQHVLGLDARSIRSAKPEGAELLGLYAESVRDEPGVLLRRTQSWSDFVTRRCERRNSSWWPRHLSFSIAEDAILSGSNATSFDDDWRSVQDNLQHVLAKEEAVAVDAKRSYSQILSLQDRLVPWVQERVKALELVNVRASQDQEQLHALYYQRLNEYHDLRTDSHELAMEKRNQLMDALREIDILGAKLDYEVNALGARVEDVEDVVEGIERQVFALEVKAQEFEDTKKATEGWLRWGFRLLTGIGNRAEGRL